MFGLNVQSSDETVRYSGLAESPLFLSFKATLIIPIDP